MTYRMPVATNWSLAVLKTIIPSCNLCNLQKIVAKTLQKFCKNLISYFTLIVIKLLADLDAVTLFKCIQCTKSKAPVIFAYPMAAGWQLMRSTRYKKDAWMWGILLHSTRLFSVTFTHFTMMVSFLNRPCTHCQDNACTLHIQTLQISSPVPVSYTHLVIFCASFTLHQISN